MLNIANNSQISEKKILDLSKHIVLTELTHKTMYCLIINNDI